MTNPEITPTDCRYHLDPLPGPCTVGSVMGALLRTPGRILYETASGRFWPVVLGLALTAVACLAIYGLVVGSLVGGNQLWVAPAKILLGCLLSATLCLPSLYIFLCMSGADIGLRHVTGELLAAVALMALLLLGFAPVAWVFSQSTDSVALMAFMHLAFWLVAWSFGLNLMGRGTHTNGGFAHGILWRVLYLAVCLQMMTTLRPIVGSSPHFFPTEKKFFLMHAVETLTGGGRTDSAL